MLAAIVRESGWTQAEAANRCGLTQPRINDLLRGRLSRFSLDALVNIAAALGQRVHVELSGRYPNQPRRPQGRATGGCAPWRRKKTRYARGVSCRPPRWGRCGPHDALEAEGELLSAFRTARNHFRERFIIGSGSRGLRMDAVRHLLPPSPSAHSASYCVDAWAPTSSPSFQSPRFSRSPPVRDTRSSRSSFVLSRGRRAALAADAPRPLFWLASVPGGGDVVVRQRGCRTAHRPT